MREPVCAVVPAAGRGERLGRPENKALVEVAGRPLLLHTVRRLAAHPEIDAVVVAVADRDRERCRTLFAKHDLPAPWRLVAGGASRQGSVLAGVRAAGALGAEWVAVHDAARPLVTPETISRTLAAAREHGAAIAALPVADTVHRAGPDGLAAGTLDRSTLFLAQTPQVARRTVLLSALEAAERDGYSGTDEAAALAQAGVPVKLAPGDPGNLKVTTPEDLAAAARALGAPAGLPRIGHGYDIHRFAPGRRLVLGGVELPGVDGRGLIGHSDADVVLHAAADALLGACGLPDIGHHFPNTDPACRDLDSRALLAEVRRMVERAGFRPGNLDITLIAEAPKIAAHLPTMKERIAGAVGLTPEAVGLKATTHERLGALGAGEGIACHAVALVVPLPR